MQDFRVTKREILFSIIIVCLFLILGMFINSKIQEGYIDREEKFYRALKIEDEESYKYAVKTNAGNLLLYDTAVSNQPVSISEITGKYSKITRVTERYTEHIRTVTHTDSDGNTYTEEVVEYSWDTYDTDKYSTQTLSYMGENMSVKFFELGQGYRVNLNSNVTSGYANRVHNNYIYENSSFFERVGDLRYSYYTYPKTFDGTMFLEYDETGTIMKDSDFFYNKSIQGTLEKVSKNVENIGIYFWIFWVVVILAVLFVFYYADNRWLEDNKKRR